MDIQSRFSPYELFTAGARFLDEGSSVRSTSFLITQINSLYNKSTAQGWLQTDEYFSRLGRKARSGVKLSH